MSLLIASFVKINPDAAPVVEDMTALGVELKARGWTVALTHYRQAVDKSTDGEFESSNAQLRSFLEVLLTRVVVDCNGAPSVDSKGNIDKLTDSGMLVRDEAEFLKAWSGLATPTARTPASARVTSPGSAPCYRRVGSLGSGFAWCGDSCRSCSVKHLTLLSSAAMGVA
jgi:hypothetical protein